MEGEDLVLDLPHLAARVLLGPPTRVVGQSLGRVAERGAREAQALQHPDRVPTGRPLSVPQLLDDLQQVEELIKGLPHDGQQQLDVLASRYQCAPPPQAGHKASMWYRMRMLSLDWSENWSRLTRFQSWRGPASETLDGTNNVTERIIGQYIKERYRSMRGYKRKQSILNVSGLIGWLGMQPAGYDLGQVA